MQRTIAARKAGLDAIHSRGTLNHSDIHAIEVRGVCSLCDVCSTFLMAAMISSMSRLVPRKHFGDG